METKNFNGPHSRLYHDEHPFLNPMLFTQIFNYASPSLTLQDVKNIRSVCKLWNQVSFSRWREIGTLKLVKPTDILEGVPTNGIPASQYFRHLKNNKEEDSLNLNSVLFHRYKFSGMTVEMGQHEKNAKSKKFWKQVGPQIEYLHLENCAIPRSPYRPQMVPLENVLKKCPKLQELVVTTFGNNAFEADDNITAIQNDMKLRKLLFEGVSHLQNCKRLTIDGNLESLRIPELIRCLPKLEVLKLKNIQEKFFTNNLFKVLHFYRERSDFTVLNIQELDLMGTDIENTESILYFPRARLPLKILRVQVQTFEDQSLLKKLVAGYTESLKVLEICNPPLKRVFPREPLFDQVMPKLTELRLWGNVTQNLNFLEKTPNLKVLWINLWCIEKWQGMKRFQRKFDIPAPHPLENDNVLGSNLRENMTTGITDFHIDYEFSTESFEMLAKLMPGLKKLETILSQDSFGGVCKYWPKLEELRCLLGSRIDDKVVTGARMEISGMMHSNIKELRCLKSFRSDDFCGTTRLTEQSLYNGFLEMPRLEKLEICAGGLFEMTELAEEMLKKAIPFVKLVRPCGYQMESPLACKFCKFQKIASATKHPFGHAKKPSPFDLPPLELVRYSHQLLEYVDTEEESGSEEEN